MLVDDDERIKTVNGNPTDSKYDYPSEYRSDK
jgi:hypothetical protein